MAATIDEISRGRVVVGLGAGWQANEHARYGIDLGTARERSDRLEEASAMIRSLLDNSRTSFDGAHYALDQAPCEPSGADGRIPLLIAGGGERRTLRTVARFADEWNTWAHPHEVVPKRDVIDRWCEEVDRDPAEIRITIAVMAQFCDSTSQRDRVRDRLGNHGGLVGASADDIRAAVAGYIDAGVDELVIADFNLPLEARADILGRLQQEVLDEFR
jgi:alkanesulfonate monooxygenase SsuD/methylene tetrahydromethanopterin reductase-like flavin-dependent oxidoreductase (luciferase family)